MAQCYLCQEVTAQEDGNPCHWACRADLQCHQTCFDKATATTRCCPYCGGSTVDDSIVSNPPKTCAFCYSGPDGLSLNPCINARCSKGVLYHDQCYTAAIGFKRVCPHCQTVQTNRVKQSGAKEGAGCCRTCMGIICMFWLLFFYPPLVVCMLIGFAIRSLCQRAPAQ